MNWRLDICLRGGKRGSIVLLLLAAVCAGWVSSAAADPLNASLDHNSIAVGDTATLTLKFENANPQSAPPLPDVPGLGIAFSDTSTEQEMFIGASVQNNTAYIFHYTITGQRPGVYTIPSIAVQINGVQYASQPINLRVVPGTPVVMAKLVVPTKQMYVGEAGQVEMQLWLRDDVQGLNGVEFTSLAADGFNVGKWTEGQTYQAQNNGRNYRVIPLHFTITAVKSGSLSVGPFTVQMVVSLPAQNGENNPFFFFNQSVQKRISIDSDTNTIAGLPLPENPPPGFTGAVGQFKMTVSAGPTTVSAGDPVTLKVRIEGHGALDSVALPDFSGWNGFKTYPPTAKTEYSDQQGLQGSRTFEEIITPQNSDVHEIPAISFSYFDPRQKRYLTLSQPATPITVHPTGAAPVPTVAAGAKPNQENTAAQQADILPVKQDLGPLVAAGAPLVTQPAFLAVQGLPVLALVAAVIWRRRADNLANNPRLRRQRQVAQMVQSGLVELRKLAGENNSEQFFAALFRLLQEQLGACLDCPASAITEAVVDERLVRLPAGGDTVTAVRELFLLCNQARYAPVRDPQELAAVAAKFEKAAGALQTLKA